MENIFYKPFSKSEIYQIDSLLNHKSLTFKRGETSEARANVTEIFGLIKYGDAQIISIDEDGNEFLMEYFEPGDFFNGQFYPLLSDNTVLFKTKTRCSVSLYDANDLKKTGRGDFPRDLFLRMTGNAFTKYKIHLDVLSKKRAETSILTYFQYVSMIKKSKKFRLPLTLTDLALYTGQNRSSMMRIIKNLNDDGLLISKGNMIERLNFDGDMLDD